MKPHDIATQLANELFAAQHMIAMHREMDAECHEIAAQNLLQNLAEQMGFSLVKSPCLLPLDKAAAIGQSSYGWEKARGD